MLEKICYAIFAEKRLKKMYRISKIAYFLGVILILGFPLLTKVIKIEEKQLRNTNLYSNKIPTNDFNSYIKSYFYEPNPKDKILNFCNQIFFNSTNKPYNYVFSKDIVCPRCSKLQLIQLNLIYDQSLKNLDIMKKSNFIFYALMRILSNENYITWLSKDIQFNYITKELFDKHPEECYEILTNGKYNKKIEDGKFIHAIYNFDLAEIDIEHFYQILLKCVGLNSEFVDIDFYKMVSSNFQGNFKNTDFYLTTNDEVLSIENKKSILNILNFFGDIFKNFMPVREYKIHYLYLIENIMNNFFMINNKINTNHYLVSHGYSSVYIKTFGKKVSKNTNKNKLVSTYYNFIATTLVLIKGITNEEVDIFRGLYFYLLTSPTHCINYFYLFVLILMCIREFFNLIDLIYHNEYRFIWKIKNPFDKIDKKQKEEKNENEEEEINNNITTNNTIYGSRIISSLFFFGILYIFFMINIEEFMKLIKEKKVEYVYYYMIGIIFATQLLFLFALKLSKGEERFIDIIIMYLNVLNCWDFVFINVGIGVAMSAILMTMEFIFLHLKQIKKNLFKIGVIILILYYVLGWKELIISMVNNHIKYSNNVYTIITISVILLTLRLALFIIMLLNKYLRKEPWDYDETIDIQENIEEEENKEEKDEEKKIEENKEENDDEDDEKEENKENKIIEEEEKKIIENEENKIIEEEDIKIIEEEENNSEKDDNNKVIEENKIIEEENNINNENQKSECKIIEE